MKRKILSLIKKSNLTLVAYRSYRSDMGCQVFDIWVAYDNGLNIKIFDDSYFVGQLNGREYILKSFTDFIKETINEFNTVD